MFTLAEILASSTAYLAKAGVSTPRLDAEVLLSKNLGLTRTALYLNFQMSLLSKELSSYKEQLRERAQRIPLAYITGEREFWSLCFNVNKNVMIPRPETEVLVEKVLKLFASNDDHPAILDLGTGSGNIAVAMAKEFPNAHVWASDISENAIEVAMKNAEKHGVYNRINFIKGDFFAPLNGMKSCFDLVVSNPPYVPTGVVPTLEPEVRSHEPHIALDGGEDGLQTIYKIVQDVVTYLKPCGYMGIEIGADQAEKVCNIIKSNGHFDNIEVVYDYGGLSRAIWAQRIG